MSTFTVTTELLLDGVWTDISADVRQADAVTITRGRADEASTADPSSCTLTINNRDGKYSPRNPLSPYFGVLGRNTQLRVTADGGLRFVGEVSSWPQRWDKTGRDRYVPIQASGLTRRLGQGATALRSALYRHLSTASNIRGYWPCEDGEGAREFASGLPGGSAMRWVYGSAEPAAFDEFVASAPLPLASQAGWTSAVPPYTPNGLNQIGFLCAVPSGGVPNTSTLVSLIATGSANVWTLNVNSAGALRLQAFEPGPEGTYTQIADTGFVAFDVNGRLLWITINLDSTTANIDYRVATLEVGATTPTFGSTGTLNSRTVGRIRRVTMNASVDGTARLDDVAMGHVVVRQELAANSSYIAPLNAFTGELATDRITRICGEESVPVTIVGDPTDAALVGPQTPSTLLDLVREAADADMGILYEPRDSLGLAYRTRASLYVQDAAVTLDYEAGTLTGIEPVEDDDATKNDITVSRVSGSSARARLETGPLSVNAPPDGVGRYEDDVTISLSRDDDLPDQASWRLHVGTVDEARFPVLGVSLANAAFTTDAGLTADMVALDVGDRLVVTNPLAGVGPPEDITQILQGYTETIGQYDWAFEANCTPSSPWDVSRWDDASGVGEARYSSDGSTLSAAVSPAGSALVMNGVASGRAATADTAVLDITGDIDVRVHVAMTDWTPTGTQTLVSKSTGSGNQRSWQFNVNSSGNLVFIWSATGIATLSATSTATPTVADGAALWVRATLDVDNGASGRTVTFYTSTDGQTWVQLGSTVTTAGVTSIFNSTAGVNVGAIDVGATNRLVGNVHSVEIRNGITGTVVANPVFAAQAPGTVSFADASGLTWGVSSPAVIGTVSDSLFPGTLLVNTPSGPVWSDADAPYDVMIGGERMTVSNVEGAGADQVFTVTRSVNGIHKAHASGAEVRLFHPAVAAL